jgi:hypothetical protein
MADTDNRTGLVPGFEFMQSLARTAGATLPNMGQWVAPTLDPDEIAKRIEELRTVQFWLEQNARMIATTIQALEVQRMTLSTLRTMNVQMDDLRRSMTLEPDPPQRAAPGAAGVNAEARPAPQANAEDAAPPSSSAASGGAVDPMQWWSALTRQFGDLAASALQGAAGPQPAQAETGAPAGNPVPGKRPQSAPIQDPDGRGGGSRATGKTRGKRKGGPRDAAGD